MLAPAASAQASSATVQAHPSHVNQARHGRGFGRRSPTLRYLLGLAYLFNVLFGWPRSAFERGSATVSAIRCARV